MNKLQNAILVLLILVIATFVAVYSYVTLKTAPSNAASCNYPGQQTKLSVLHDCY